MGTFREDGTYIYLNDAYCEFYIPMYYFEKSNGFAKDNIDKINTLGVFNVGIFSNGQLKEIKTFNLPNFIDLRIYKTEERNVTLNGVSIKCKVCKYYKDNIITSAVLIEDSDNAQSYLNMIISGGLPNTIPYSRALEVWRKNLELNNVSFGVSSTILELIISVVYREKGRLDKKFSKKFGSNPRVSEFDYSLASIRQICQYASTFTALTYEDMDTMITTSLNRQRDGIKETETPLEQIIKM